MKKLISLLMILAVVCGILLVFTACNDDEPTPPAESESESQSEQPPVESDVELKLMENKQFNYDIIRGEQITEGCIALATEFYLYVNSLSENDVSFSTDYNDDYLKTQTHDPERYEIIFGVSNYEQNAELVSNLGIGEFKVEVDGNKIFIVAFADEAMERAVTRLKTAIREAYDEETGNIVINSAEIEGTMVADKELNTIPYLSELALETIYECGNGSKMIVQRNAKPEHFQQYLNKLNEKEFKKISESEANKNLFATYESEHHILTVNYIEHKDRLTVTYDTRRTFSTPSYDDNWDESKKVCDAKLIQIGVTPIDNDAPNGESYLIRCEDGSFIAFDGGFSGNEAGKTPRNNAKLIYDTLVKYNPDPSSKPRVAAWITTHFHADHYGALKTFLKTYAAKVDVESFIYNFPFPQYATYTEEAYTNLIQSFKTAYPKAEHIKAHTGQRFRFANIEMEVLYTAELLMSTNIEFFNDTSLVCRLYSNGQSIMMAGDMSPDANLIIRRMYVNYLKSDFYQVAHHGGRGGSEEFNKLCAPKWVLWPISERVWDTYKAHSRNAWLSDKNSTVEIIFPAWFQTTVINLPFDGTESGYLVYQN